MFLCKKWVWVIFCKKRKQSADKPGSVRQQMLACLSFIHSMSRLMALAFYPLPTVGRATLMAVVYMNLQLPRCTASMSPYCW